MKERERGEGQRKVREGGRLSSELCAVQCGEGWCGKGHCGLMQCGEVNCSVVVWCDDGV